LNVPIGEYTRESIPLFVAVSLVTLALVFMPSLVLWVPNMFFGY